MDLVREDMEMVGAKEGDEVDRVLRSSAVATPNREKPKEENESRYTARAGKQQIHFPPCYRLYKPTPGDFASKNSKLLSALIL